MTCRCRSYNRPDWNPEGDRPEVVVKAPAWADRPTICLDACIADVIQALWTHGMETLGCCCGHGKIGPSVLIASHMDGQRAHQLLRQLDDRDWTVQQWRVVTIDEGGNTLRWRFGPTADDPTNSHHWCLDCGGKVEADRKGYTCTQCHRTSTN